MVTRWFVSLMYVSTANSIIMIIYDVASFTLLIPPPLSWWSGQCRERIPYDILTAFRCMLHYCDLALSVVRPSVVVNFLHFRLLLWNFVRNLTKLGRKQELNVIYQVNVFRADQTTKMATRPLICWDIFDFPSETAERRLGIWRNLTKTRTQCISRADWKLRWPPGLWLAETIFISPLKPLNGIWRNLTGSKNTTSSTMFMFFGPIRQPRWPPGLWMAETFLTSLKPLNGIWRNLTGSRNSASFAMFCGLVLFFFFADRKTKMIARHLIGWDIFDFFSETAERNLTKIDRKQEHNVLYQVCVFGATNMATLAILSANIWPFGTLLLEYMFSVCLSVCVLLTAYYEDYQFSSL